VVSTSQLFFFLVCLSHISISNLLVQSVSGSKSVSISLFEVSDLCNLLGLVVSMDVVDLLVVFAHHINL
jgi:hypothetical protein